ncbi:MAG: hypothetical protein HYV09_02965 [Deltaproteobacteria bacterium]|nr:hypothetical protein [Deltaproteobacteria bacterium]
MAAALHPAPPPGDGERARDVDLKVGVKLTAAYDDNPLLGRRGQFLGSLLGAKTPPDYAALPSTDARLDVRLGGHDRLRATGKYELARLRTTKELVGWDATAGVAYEKSFARADKLTPSVTFVHHREQPEWSFRAFETKVVGVYTLGGGVIVEGRWRWNTQSFGRYEGGRAPAKNSYANIDSRGHHFELELRHWASRRVRLRALHEVSTTAYDGNLSVTLADYAGLSAGVERHDIGSSSTVEIMAAPVHDLVLTFGARYEVNDSNSPAFLYRAVHALGTALVALGEGHAVYAQVGAGRYTFPENRFDRRYSNTRQDFRSDVALVYRWDASEHLRIELAVRRVDATSNDCASFSPERDPSGLPVYSRSYSCYARTRAEMSARWEL